MPESLTLLFFYTACRQSDFVNPLFLSLPLPLAILIFLFYRLALCWLAEERRTQLLHALHLRHDTVAESMYECLTASETRSSGILSSVEFHSFAFCLSKHMDKLLQGVYQES